MVDFDPNFDPRQAASVLRQAALVLEVEIDVRGEPLSPENFAVFRYELEALFPFVRAWAEHYGYQEAAEIPETIDPKLTVEEAITFLRDVAELMERLAARRERQRMN